MDVTSETVDEVNYENFKSQVMLLLEYLNKLEGLQFRKACYFLECILTPYFGKTEETHKFGESTNVEQQVEDISNEAKHFNISNNQMSSVERDHPFTSKLLNYIHDSTFLSDTLLIQNNILEEKANTFKDQVDKKTEEPGLRSFQSSLDVPDDKYEVSFKDGNSITYLDLSNKSNSYITLAMSHPKALSHTPVDKKPLENSSEILNLCSKNKTTLLSDEGKSLEDSTHSISDDFDISYDMNPSNILLEDKFVDKTTLNNCNSDIHILNSSKFQSGFRDDLSKVLSSSLKSNNAVIQGSSLKTDDKNTSSTKSTSNLCISDVETALSLSNDSRTSFKIYSPYDGLPYPIKLENHGLGEGIQSESSGILNLKKEGYSSHETIKNETVFSENLAGDDNVSHCLDNSMNSGFYAILNSLEAGKSCAESLSENEKDTSCNTRALNLVSKKFKNSKHASENLNNNTDNLEKSNNQIMTLLDIEERVDGETNATKDNVSSPVCCRKCRTEFLDFVLWTTHDKTCSENLFCNHCDIQLKSKVMYFKHLSHHKRNSCTQCPSTFSRHKHLKAHMKASHGINLVSKTFPCQHCPRVFMKKSSMYYHLQSHALPHQKACPKCGKFVDDSSYQEHMSEHIKNASLQCSLCNAIFDRFQQYNDHMLGHERHVCDYCENHISFSSKKMLFKHYKTEHPTLPQKVVLNKKYSCDQCYRVFTRPSLLEDHKLTHTNVKHIECPLCGIKYAQRNSLKKHLKNVHSFDASNHKNRQQCKLCQFSCSSVSLLNKHSIKIHNTVLSHSCSYCDYKTKHTHLLKRHMDTHLKRKFLCDICGSLFHSASTLKYHKVFLHSNERRFQCEECSKCFKKKSCLARHIRTHSSEKPYKCEECGCCYKQHSHLTRHLSSAHHEKLTTKKFKKVVNGETRDDDTDLAPDENATVSSASLVSTAEKANSDILLPPNSTVLMTEGSTPTDTTPLFTVLDSQLIHLFPSTLQLQEGIQTVSLVNGELHTLSITNPTYQITQDDTFSSSAAGDAIIIHSTNEPDSAISIENLQSENSVELSEGKLGNLERVTITGDSHQKEGDSPHLTLDETHPLSFAPSSLQDLHYRDGVGEAEPVTALSTTHYLTHQDTTLSQDISNNNSSNNNIAIF